VALWQAEVAGLPSEPRRIDMVLPVRGEAGEGSDGGALLAIRGAHRRTSPYRVYELTPTVAYAFGTGDNLGERSTRFRSDA
jgi:hypothetical protein